MLHVRQCTLSLINWQTTFHIESKFIFGVSRPFLNPNSGQFPKLLQARILSWKMGNSYLWQEFEVGVLSHWLLQWDSKAKVHIWLCPCTVDVDRAVATFLKKRDTQKVAGIPVVVVKSKCCFSAKVARNITENVWALTDSPDVILKNTYQNWVILLTVLL